MDLVNEVIRESPVNRWVLLVVLLASWGLFDAVLNGLGIILWAILQVALREFIVVPLPQ